MFFVLCVLHDSTLLQDVLTAWSEAGVTGATVLASTGMGRITEQAALRGDLPLFPSLEDLVQHDEETNRTLFTVVKDESMVDRVAEATQKVVGDLNLPNTGILVVLPVVRAYGLERKRVD